jgi:hypothetical protein
MYECSNCLVIFITYTAPPLVYVPRYPGMSYLNPSSNYKTTPLLPHLFHGPTTLTMQFLIIYVLALAVLGVLNACVSATASMYIGICVHVDLLNVDRLNRGHVTFYLPHTRNLIRSVMYSSMAYRVFT